MIYYERRVAPSVFEFAELRKSQQERIQDWLKQKKPFALRSPIEDSRVVKSLCEMFKGKCAYCEIKLEAEIEADVSYFRPPKWVFQQKGDAGDPEHYLWLSWEWFNLYWACKDCIKNKGSVFPTRKERAKPGTYGADLLLEEPQLLDPCLDNPLVHLEFAEDGSIKAKQGSQRGIATIEILNLNRQLLRTARQKEAQILKQQFEEILQIAVENRENLSSDTFARIRRLKLSCEDDQQFAGMKRQLLHGWLIEKKGFQYIPEEVWSNLEELIPWQNLINQLNRWLNEIPTIPYKEEIPDKSIEGEKKNPPSVPPQDISVETNILLKRLSGLQQRLVPLYDNLNELKHREAILGGFDLAIRNQIKEHERNIAETKVEITEIENELVRRGHKFL